MTLSTPSVVTGSAAPGKARQARLAALAERSVPRYTSYPTAPHFNAEVTGETYGGWLAQLSPCTTLSLYLHVPFCAAMCSYCGCHTKVTRRAAPIEAYRGALAAEIDLVAGLTTARRVHHLHWGGGTPTMLGEKGLAAIVERLARRFDFAEDLDHAIELDPRHVTSPLAVALKRMGVTRASLGVQDLNLHVQEAIGRVQPHEVVARAVAALRDAGIAAISFDLMYGLPEQTEADLLRTIGLAAALTPDRIALFGYAHVPWMKPHQRLIDKGKLPDAAARLAQAESARAALEALGYKAIGFDHFARPTDPMAVAAHEQRLKRNFQGYTTDDAEVLVGLGASAIGRLPQGFVQNAPDFAGYQRAVGTGRLATVRGLALTPEDRIRGEVIERLMCDFAVDLDAVAARFDLAPAMFDADLAGMAPLEGEGLVHRDGRKVVVAAEGRPLVRLVAAAFDARLAQAGRHSAAV